jgi:oxaloacetate decarboxylase gamma subunit
MTIADMLQQSAILTILGMGVVFAFLWVMIICVSWVGKLIHAAGMDKDILPQQNNNAAAGGVKPEITAAITAAVTESRKNQ